MWWTRRANRIPTLLVVCVALLPACDDKKATGTAPSEDLTIVVEADRSKISEEEDKLRARQQAFAEQRDMLRKEKEELMDARSRGVGKDKVQEKRLIEKEQQLWQKEQEMWAKEGAMDKERQALAKQKSDLLSKVGNLAGGTSGGLSIEQRENFIATREKGMASREKDLALREKELAQREENLARREAALARNQLDVASGPTTITKVSKGGVKHVTAKQAEGALKTALARFQKKGVLLQDLPEAASLHQQALAARKEGDWSRMDDIAEQMEQLAGMTRIDAAFIEAKYTRLNQVVKKKQLQGKDKITVANLNNSATQLANDGRFGDANRELNKIFALLNQ